MESIQSLAAALRAREILPWAEAPSADFLRAAWEGSDDAVSMAAIVAYLKPARLAPALAEAAAEIPLEAGPSSRDAVYRLYAVITAHQVAGPARAHDELEFTLRTLPGAMRDLVSELVCASLRRAVPELSTREVIAAVSAR